MMSIANSIVSLFEIHSLSVEEIAAELKLEPLAVKSCLLQYSQEYRKKEHLQVEDKEEELVSKDEVKEFLAAYKNIARYSEEIGIKERALKNLINMGLKVSDGLGESREDVVKEGGNTNILILSQHLEQARAAKSKVIDGVNKILDLPSTSNEEEVNGG